ncbi:unnamed protein product [Phytophthora fragariaefolia]|uniref:Unnamed protein product n=1 Tax=Phytophthora fragariaefolia TaxID=1490495 RepID=A0A9W6XGB4_9STRA|nr:unnamed protein product [Phytophthora fragariaefolia]
MSLLDPEGVSYLASQGQDAVNERPGAFSSYENAMLEHLEQRMTAVTASVTPTTTSTNGPKPMPLMVSVETFTGKEGESLLPWTRELKMAMGSALLRMEQQRVALAISKRGGRAREWSHTCGTSVETSFPIREQLKQQRSRRAVLSNTERVCKPGLLVVQATVKGFDKPWTILVDSGASGNYARRSKMEGSQLYAEALKARTRDIVAVRLATGTRVTVPKVPVDLGVKFLDFDSVQRCLVLDLDARYDLILGMAWLERHEPWIDWWSKTLGSTHFSASGALASHEPTSARKQKHFWREHLTETVNVLDIGMSYGH